MRRGGGIKMSDDEYRNHIIDPMNFARNYPKLWEPRFSTIRRHNKWKVYSYIPVKALGKYIYHAFVISRQRLTFNEIPLSILLKDTNTDSRKCALQLLNSFYQIPIDPIKEKLNLYWLLPVYNTFKQEIYNKKYENDLSESYVLAELKAIIF